MTITRTTLLLLVAAPLSGCVVADFKTGRLYNPAEYRSIQQCNGATHTRRIMTQNGINDNYMMSDCPNIPAYQPAQRMEGR